MNRGVRPGSVGRKKGAAAGAAGGAAGLFLLYKHNIGVNIVRFKSTVTFRQHHREIIHDVMSRLHVGSDHTSCSHLDDVQVQETFPSRLWQQRQSHKLRPQLISRLIRIISLLWCNFLFWLVRCDPRQRLHSWLVVSREGAEPHRSTKTLIGPEGGEMHCDWLLQVISWQVKHSSVM